ncbi:sensor histidine kinase [Bacillus horti]|uniref:histidine kinase n=1 Tax=Caldalkalibacillus horti TaxID=77523 RepID=A0ABT9VT93_9BACI|nr:sensor histidine kinase [Bacillus horti]MDQ0164202.1 signal transduction histidine kinase [Bacillus horti]
MKLFIKDHVSLTLFFTGIMGISTLIYWLSGQQDIWITGYALFISSLFFFLYLIIRYIRHRKVYALIEEQHSLEEMNNPTGETPLAEAFGAMLRQNYQMYEKRLRQYEQKTNEHVNFMNQWVHQMKTPISVIQLTLQDEDDVKSLSIKEETEKIRRGLQTVLYVARLDTFEQDFRVDKVNLWKAAQEAVQENKGMFIRNQVYPQIEMENPNWVETDEKWCVFILNQLIINAIRYSAGTQSKVTIRSYRKGINMVLEVEDHGIGIPKQDVKRVFEPFFTGENGRQIRESTGMGLYLVKQVCDKLGHSIELESEPNEGTAIRIVYHGAVH